MLIKSETTLRIIILSFVTIASSSTPMSNSMPHSRRHLCKGLTNSMSKIGTSWRVKAMPRVLEASPPIDRSARRIFFWPWHNKWWHNRWWHRRPFGFNAGVYGGIGVGIGPGGGLGFRRPVRVPGFGGTPGIGVGLGAGIGAGYRPGVGITAGAGAVVGAGVVPSSPNYGQYQPDASSTISDNNDSEEQPINYPDLPPVTNDFNGEPPIPSNGPDFNAPSAVGFDDGTDHLVGYDRAVHKSLGYKNQGYLKRDPGRYNWDANYDIDRGSTQESGSYMTIGDTNKQRVLQWFRDRHKKVPTGQSEHEGSQNYLKRRETNSYGRDYEGEEQDYYDEDRYRDYPMVEQQFFTDRDLAHVNDAV